MRTALVTGSAGFIGSFVGARLLAGGFRVVGLDAMTDYYDVALKERRLENLSRSNHFRSIEGYVETPGLLAELFAEEAPEVVIHLAASPEQRRTS